MSPVPDTLRAACRLRQPSDLGGHIQQSILVASRASAMPSWMPIFSNNRLLCVFTVLALRLRRRAISSWRRPRTSSIATSSSRGVSRSNGEAAPSMCDSAMFCAMLLPR
jgi:hypothetical protein